MELKMKILQMKDSALTLGVDGCHAGWICACRDRAHVIKTRNG